MNNKVGICLLLLFFVIQIPSQTVQAGAPFDKTLYQNLNPLPSDRAAYEYFVRKISVLESLGNSGKVQSSTIYNQIRKEFFLNDTEASTVREVTLACLNEVLTLDLKAHAIIQQARQKYPQGVIKGKPRPECPTELYNLQFQRDNAFLKVRLNLRQALGEIKFVAFDNVVRQLISKSRQRR